MTPQCPTCGVDVLDIDVKCTHCGAVLGATGAHKMIGQIMLGQYELVDVLGQGGMSVVFKGKHKMTDQEVALKILPPELAAHSQVKSRFLEEAKALAALDHPNIVHLYNFGQEAGYFVLAMQFVQGQTWERMILEAKRLDWRVSCKITCDVLRALEYAHDHGVVHRDMKPSNVLVRKENGSATVMDFGIAKMTTSTRLTATGQTMGTVRYMSPEQVRGQEVDLKTDIYSLGATLYESLVGDTPFDGQTHFEIMTKHLSEPPQRPSSLGIEVPPTVEDALMRSLSKRADDRFGGAREMRKILEAALRAADPGLVDTQKVSGNVLTELRSPKQPSTPPSNVSQAPTSRRVATASDLADELEPSGSHPRRRSLWPWIALGVLVVAGGAVAAVLVLDRGAASGPFSELAFVPTTVGRLKIHTTADTNVVAADVAAAYQREVLKVDERINDVLRGKRTPIQVDPLDEIFVIPQRMLCTKEAYPESTLPPRIECSTDSYAVPASGRWLYLVAGQWQQGLERGVLEAACLYNMRDGTRVEELCELAAGPKPDGTPDPKKQAPPPPEKPVETPKKTEPPKKSGKRVK